MSAAVEGGAAGAGLSIALACDMLVVARNAFLSEFVSRQILTELCLTGDRITSERLQAMGAVNRLTDKGAALAEAVVLAARLAIGPTRASARIKALCLNAFSADLEAQMELEAQLMVESQGDDEAAQGIGSFFAKRLPDFVALRGRPNAN